MAQLLLKMEDDAKARWLACAKGESLTLSEWLRRAAEVRAGSPPVEMVLQAAGLSRSALAASLKPSPKSTPSGAPKQYPSVEAQAREDPESLDSFDRGKMVEKYGYNWRKLV